MAFEYRNSADDRLAVAPLGDVVWLKTTPGGCEIPPNRVEEVIAGIRDAARQTTGQTDAKATAAVTLATSCDNCDHALNWHGNHAACIFAFCGCGRFSPPEAAVEQPDPTTASDPTPLRWGLGDVLHGDDDTTIVCLSGPDRKPYWLELEPERAAALRDDLARDTAKEQERAEHRTAVLREVVAKQLEWLRSHGYDTECICDACSACLAREYIDLINPDAHLIEEGPES